MKCNRNQHKQTISNKQQKTMNNNRKQKTDKAIDKNNKRKTTKTMIKNKKTITNKQKQEKTLNEKHYKQ